MGMWDTLKKAQKQPPINVANGDVLVIEEIQGGETTVRADTRVAPSGPRPKFKPVDPAAVTQLVIEEPIRDTPSNHFDLVGDDIGAPSPTGKPGRPRLYPTNAARQKAHRDRRKNG